MKSCVNISRDTSNKNHSSGVPDFVKNVLFFSVPQRLNPEQTARKASGRIWAPATGSDNACGLAATSHQEAPGRNPLVGR